MTSREVYEIYRTELERYGKDSAEPWENLDYSEKQKWEAVADELNFKVEQDRHDGEYERGFDDGYDSAKDDVYHALS